MRDMCDQTAVMRRNEIVTIRRSIIGIMLISESSALRVPAPVLPTLTPAIDGSSHSGRRARPTGKLGLGREAGRFSRATCLSHGFSILSGSLGDAGEVHLLTVRHDQVEHLHARLVDVVLEVLRLAVEDGVADEADDGDDEAEGGAVHRLAD